MFKKGFYWDYVPDDHKCLSCLKTKHEETNFTMFTTINGLKPYRRCTVCVSKKSKEASKQERIEKFLTKYNEFIKEMV